MRCESFKLPGGVTAIVCTRGMGRTTKVCVQCGRRADRLCDWPLGGSKTGKTCDRPICSRCALSQPSEDGSDTLDYCPPHARLYERQGPPRVPDEPEPSEPQGKAQIRGLTLHQPWAWAICNMEPTEHVKPKRIENRMWSPPQWMLGQYIAIHAGKTLDLESVHWIQTTFGIAVPANLVLGAVVGVGKLVSVLDYDQVEEELQEGEAMDPWFVGPKGLVLDEVLSIDPVKCRGMQKLWTLPDGVYQQVRANWRHARNANVGSALR